MGPRGLEIIHLSRYQANQHNIDKWDMLKLLDYFNAVDEDGSGEIDLEEFQQLLRKVYKNRVDDEAIADIFKVYDADGTGSMDLDEFFYFALSHGIV